MIRSVKVSIEMSQPTIVASRLAQLPSQIVQAIVPRMLLTAFGQPSASLGDASERVPDENRSHHINCATSLQFNSSGK